MMQDLRIKQINFLSVKRKMSLRSLPFALSRQSGFTLIELLVYMGIFSILLMILVQLFTLILDVRLESEATSSVEQDGNYIMSRLTTDIMSATNITEPLLTSPVSSSNQLHIIGTGNSFDNTYKTAVINGQTMLVQQNNLANPVTQVQLNSVNTQVKSITFYTYGNIVNGSLVNGPGAKNSVQITLVLDSTIVRLGQARQETTFTTTVQERGTQ